MAVQLTALILFIAVFAIATLRGVHIGILMFAAACGVGVWLAEMPLKDVLGGFPIGIMVLLVGVTYFFGIARANGTIDRMIEAALGRAGDNAVMVPFIFFALTAVVSARGSPLAGLVMAPVGMPVAKKYRMDPMLMALAIGTGLSAGAFAPTSLFGIVSYGTAQRASIDLSPLTLWAVAVIANFVLLIAAFLIFGGPKLVERRGTFPTSISADASRAPFAWNQFATIVCMIGLVVAVIACSMAGLDPDIGVLSFAFGAALTLIDPNSGRTAVSRIDWSTVLLVGGIVTFVGVLHGLRGSAGESRQERRRAHIGRPGHLCNCRVGLRICFHHRHPRRIGATSPTGGGLRTYCGLGAHLRTRRLFLDRGCIPVLHRGGDAGGCRRRGSAPAHDVASDSLGHVHGGDRPPRARRDSRAARRFVAREAISAEDDLLCSTIIM